MSLEQVEITLPLPSRQLSPNSRGGTRWKSHVVKRHREDAAMAAQIAIYECKLNLDYLPWDRVEAQETYYWPTRRRRDVRNAESSMKAYWDGLVQGGLLKDDDIEHLTHLPSRFSSDKENPRVVMILKMVS